ncbi:MAG: EAL domain-containing protein [Limnobacter sp.]|nr:EAL domain-containing protein [Limnobacter sp.]
MTKVKDSIIASTMAKPEPTKPALSLKRKTFGLCLACSAWVGLLPWVFLESQRSDFGLFDLSIQAITGLLLIIPLASWLCSVLITGSIRTDLFALTQIAKSFSEGQYSHRFKSTGVAEIDQLSKSLNDMATLVDERDRYIRRTAYKDQLTGLHNRAYLIFTLRERISHAKEPLSLATWSIDNLENINEVLGYDFADQVLKTAAKKAQRIAKNSLVSARLEGNVFSILLPRSIFDRISKTIDLRRLLIGELKISGHFLDLECHAGIAHFPEHGENPESLLRRAEIARQIAKKTHNPMVVFEEAFEQRSTKRLALIGELKKAIVQNEFELYLQPKMSVRSGKVTQAEVLIRWRHPERGMIQPNAFIPLAEQTGLIKNITLWLFEQVYAITPDFNSGNVQLSVNISALDLEDNTLLKWVERKHKYQPQIAGNITIEVTESSTMRDPDQACELLQGFANMGFKIAIDDFGSGYSSLAYLKRFPVTELKIDRSLVQGIDIDSDARVILQSTIEMGHVMGLLVTAEGVETDAEYQLIHELGADFLQGYWLSKPLPMQTFKEAYLFEPYDHTTQPA